VSPDEIAQRNRIAEACFLSVFGQAAGHRIAPGENPAEAIARHWQGAAAASFMAANAFIATQRAFTQEDTPT
jgi:hypothetical protein